MPNYSVPKNLYNWRLVFHIQTDGNTLIIHNHIVMAAQDPWKPSSYGPSKTALLLLDYEKAHIDMIEDPKRREAVIIATKKLLTTARENNVAIVHCLMDTTSDPPRTNKGTEKWHSTIKPMLAANPDIAVEYSDFVMTAANEGAVKAPSIEIPDTSLH